MKRYVRLGYEITEGQDIEDAVQNLAGTHIAHLEPNRENGLYIAIKQIINKLLFFLYKIFFLKMGINKKKF